MTKTNNKAGDLFLLIVGTALTVFLFITGLGELAAVGLVIGIITICGWHSFISNF